MWVINKTKDPIYTKLYKLDEGLKKLISDVYIKKKVISERQKEYVNEKLFQIKEKDQWLLCDCKKSDIPVMSIGMKGDQLYIIHMNKRGEHEEWCEFKEKEYKERKKRLRKKIAQGSYFHLHRNHSKEREEEENDNPKESNSKNQKYYSKLAKVLYTLITEAKINILSKNKKNINDQYYEIKKAAEKFKLEKGIDVNEYLWTHPKQINYSYVRLKEAKRYWPKNSRPYGVFIVIADQFTPGSFIAKIKDEEFLIKLEGVFKRSSGRVTINSGPFLVIFTVTDKAKKRGFYMPYNGFIVPVLSKADLFIVDSNYERRVANKLKSEIFNWEKIGMDVKIVKPLFDIITQSGEKVRPDFIIQANNKNVILEVQGSNESEYRIRKERVKKKMKELGSVVEFDAVKEEINNTWNDGIFRMLKTIKEKLTK